jgi:hypothetical protein
MAYYNQDFAPFLERALQEQIGVALETNNPKRLQIVLDNYIADHAGFKGISVDIPAIPNEVWLVNKSAEVLL